MDRLSPLSTKPLSMVNVNGNKITDISPIAVTNFELRATDNQISDISCLKGTTAEFIFLSNNKISDISVFEANDGLADVTEININLLFGLLFVPFGAFVYYDFGHEGMQDFGRKLCYTGIFPRKAYEFIHITCRFL